MKKYLLSAFILLLLSGNLFAQNRKQIDSLLTIIKNVKEDTARLKIYLTLFKTGEPKDIRTNAEDALKIAERIPLKNLNAFDKKRIIKYEDSLYDYIEKFDETIFDTSQFIIKYCEHLLSIYRETKDSAKFIYFTLQISARYLIQSNFPKALEYCQSGILIAEKLQNKITLADCLRRIVMIYKAVGDGAQALVIAEKPLKIYRELKDTLKIGGMLLRIGIVYGDLHKMNMCVKYFNDAIGLYEIIRNKEGLRSAYNNLGLAFQANTDNNNAMKNFKKSLSYAEELPDKTWVNGILCNIGEIYRTQNNITNALIYHNKALKVAMEIGVINGQIDQCWYYLAQDYLKLKNYKKAKEYNNSYLRVVKYGQRFIPDSKDAELLAAQIDSASGNFTDAFKHYQQYIYWRDKLNVEEVRKAAQKEKFQSDYAEQKAKDKAEQEKNALLATQKLQTQKIIRNSFIAGTILLMLLIVVLINRNKLKRSVEMEKMRSRLSRDLHDDIGSTLSSINILSRTAQTNLTQTQDEKTKASLEKINERSQRLLDNMSDIIWNINPGNDTIEEVMSRMREYATTILEAKNIDYTFNFPKEIMACKLTMEVKNNMYLIFKEAVNNLSKYSGCTHANLSLTFDEKNIHLKIEDNGIGFNEQEIKHRGGLVNMQQRAAEIKGTIQINTANGCGTQIELTMPRYC